MKEKCAPHFQSAITPEIMLKIAPFLEQRGAVRPPLMLYTLTLVWRHVTFLWPSPLFKKFGVNGR